MQGQPKLWLLLVFIYIHLKKKIVLPIRCLSQKFKLDIIKEAYFSPSYHRRQPQVFLMHIHHIEFDICFFIAMICPPWIWLLKNIDNFS